MYDFINCGHTRVNRAWDMTFSATLHSLIIVVWLLAGPPSGAWGWTVMPQALLTLVRPQLMKSYVRQYSLRWWVWEYASTLTWCSRHWAEYISTTGAPWLIGYFKSLSSAASCIHAKHFCNHDRSPSRLHASYPIIHHVFYFFWLHLLLAATSVDISKNSTMLTQSLMLDSDAT